MSERTSTATRRIANAPDSERAVHIRDVVAMTGERRAVEVYVGRMGQPVRVSSRLSSDGTSWAIAGALLRERVAGAIQPLNDADWQLDGSPVAAMRWVTSHQNHGQHHVGCWVRMRPRGK